MGKALSASARRKRWPLLLVVAVTGVLLAIGASVMETNYMRSMTAFVIGAAVGVIAAGVMLAYERKTQSRQREVAVWPWVLIGGVIPVVASAAGAVGFFGLIGGFSAYGLLYVSLRERAQL